MRENACLAGCSMSRQALGPRMCLWLCLKPCSCDCLHVIGLSHVTDSLHERGFLLFLDVWQLWPPQRC